MLAIIGRRCLQLRLDCPLERLGYKINFKLNGRVLRLVTESREGDVVLVDEDDNLVDAQRRLGLCVEHELVLSGLKK